MTPLILLLAIIAAIAVAFVFGVSVGMCLARPVTEPSGVPMATLRKWRRERLDIAPALARRIA